MKYFTSCPAAKVTRLNVPLLHDLDCNYLSATVGQTLTEEQYQELIGLVPGGQVRGVSVRVAGPPERRTLCSELMYIHSVAGGDDTRRAHFHLGVTAQLGDFEDGDPDEASTEAVFDAVYQWIARSLPELEVDVQVMAQFDSSQFSLPVALPPVPPPFSRIRGINLVKEPEHGRGGGLAYEASVMSEPDGEIVASAWFKSKLLIQPDGLQSLLALGREICGFTVRPRVG